MGKIFIILLLVLTVVILVSIYVLGFIRRIFRALFGTYSINSNQKHNQTHAPIQGEVLYSKDGTTVLRGDASNQHKEDT